MEVLIQEYDMQLYKCFGKQLPSQSLSVGGHGALECLLLVVGHLGPLITAGRR